MSLSVDKLQRIIGLTGCTFAFALLVINYLGSIPANANSMVLVIYNFTLINDLCISCLLLVTAFLFNRAIKLLQIIIIFYCIPLVLINDFQGFPGVWFLVMGLILLDRYRFLNRHILVRIALPVIWFFFWLVLTLILHYNLLAPVFIVKIIAFILMVGIFLYVICIREIAPFSIKKKLQKKEKERINVLSNIGEITSGIVHSLKNDLTTLSVATMYIESGVNTQKGLSLLKLTTQILSERLHSLLEMSRISLDKALEPTALNDFIKGFYHLFYADLFERESISFEVFGSSMPLQINKIQFIMLLESIFQNALEAFKEKKGQEKEKRFVICEVSDNGFVVTNNAGHFPNCKGKSDSCLGCKHFKKIGWTNKENHIGYGLYYVAKQCRDFGWNFYIRNVQDNEVEFHFVTDKKTIKG